MTEFDCILLTSFGGPEASEDVEPFLRNVANGRDIPAERLEEVQAQYGLFGGVSPINQQNRDLMLLWKKNFSLAILSCLSTLGTEIGIHTYLMLFKISTTTGNETF